MTQSNKTSRRSQRSPAKTQKKEIMKRSLSVRMGEELFDKIHAFAETLDRDAAWVARQAICKYLEKTENASPN